MKKVKIVNCYNGDWIKIIGFVTLLSKKCNENSFNFDNAVLYAKELAKKERLSFVYEIVTDSNGNRLSISYPNKSNVFCYIQEVFEFTISVTDNVSNDKVSLITIRDLGNVVTVGNLDFVMKMLQDTLTLYVLQLKALQIDDREKLFIDRIDVDRKDL